MFEILVVINEMDFSVEVKRKYKIKKGIKENNSYPDFRKIHVSEYCCSRNVCSTSFLTYVHTNKS